MAVILGLAGAFVYGTADFLGGLATKRASSLAVVMWSQLAGLTLVGTAIAVTGDALSSTADLGWGAAAGISGGTGVILLYRGLSIGRMSVVAPITAVGAASIPVIAGFVFGERPGPAAWVGIAVALVAIVLVSLVRGDDDRVAEGAPAPLVPLIPTSDEAIAPARRLPGRPGIVEAVAAGIAFGAFFILLGEASVDAGLWPLLSARSSIVVAGLAAVATRTTLRVSREAVPAVIGAGVLDMGANLLYLFAERRGLLSLVAVLVSLYPAATVVLARFVLSERLSRPQLAGLGAAGVGVLLIGLG